MKNAFIGNFNGRIANSANYFHGTQYNGVLCSKSFEHFSNNDIDALFAGVIYNKKELGVESMENNAEVVARIYNQKQTERFAELDGSFTFIIKTAQETIVVRDHHGTFSQVYYNDTHFASSLSLLQKSPACPTTVDHAALGSFLSVGYIPTGGSAFEGIHKMHAGNMLVYKGGKIDSINLFDTDNITPYMGDCAELECFSKQYGTLHSQAIKRRIGDSRNVGILLSGGYDSGCNLAALRQNYNGNISSFSIGFKGDNWSELPLAQCMSDTFGTNHHTYEIDGSEITSLPSIVRELGDPFVEGGLMVNYTAMKMITTNKPQIILGGDGSDQYFGTSGREVAMHYLAAKYSAKPFLGMLLNILSCEKYDSNNKPYRIRFHLNKILNILQGDLFGFERFQLKNLLIDKSHIHSHQKSKMDLRSFEHLYTQHAYKSDIEKIINQVILFKASRMADMFDNNITFPYMDLELYKFLQTLPVKYKCKGESALRIAKGEATAKFLLKYHYKSKLPQEITSKKKQGGFAPMPIFFKDKPQRDRIADMIMNSSLVGEYLERNAVEKFIKTYDKQANEDGQWFWYKQNKAIQYFNLLNLAIWWEQYVKQRDCTL